jgi:hypothetical protein
MGFGKFFSRWKSFDSARYWEKRYASGRTSGEGSYGELAEFKAQVLNDFVAGNGVKTVIEYGCGDGNQLTLSRYPSYVGFDVSMTAVGRCRDVFKADTSKRFDVIGNYRGETAELTLSLDVLYHLVEDSVFDEYMERLFGSSEKFVIIYSNNTDENESGNKPHVRFRKFTAWIEENARDWKLKEVIENRYRHASTADFFIYEKVSGS